MSNLRQRKQREDSPPALSECDSSWEKSLDGGNGDSDDSHGEEATLVSAVPKPSALDRFLGTYGSFSGSTFTADQGLKILQWSSWAISYATKSSRPNLSPSLRHFYNELSMTRYVLRFYGFLQSLEGYRSGSWAGGSWDNQLISKVAKYMMAGSMLIYYPLEHVAYAGWQMPKLVKVNANKISAVSCVFWTTYIIGDFWVSCLKWKELKQKLKDVREVLVGEKSNDEKGAVVSFALAMATCCLLLIVSGLIQIYLNGHIIKKTELAKEEHNILGKIRHIKLQILRCLLFILPSINWSLPNWATNPLLGELPLNGLMLVEAYTSVYQSLLSMCG